MLTARIVIATVVLALAPSLHAQQPEKPTKEHDYVLSGVGEWEGTIKTTMPDMEQSSPAKQTVTAVGAYWTQTRFECQFMGETYVGTGCVGYDAKKKKFVGTWIGSMDSHLAVMEGKLNADGNLEMRWQAPGPTGDLVWHRNVLEKKGDREVTTFYMGEGDKEVKFMVIDVQRKKT